MSVEFDEEIKFNSVYNRATQKTPSGLEKWLIEKSIAKSEKGAKLVMVFIIILCVALTIFFLNK
jgi:hypothetical protein